MACEYLRYPNTVKEQFTLNEEFYFCRNPLVH